MSNSEVNLTFGSLFSGIGGFDLGFDRAGIGCQWQVENDEYCYQVLGQHWPDVQRIVAVHTRAGLGVDEGE